MKVLAIRRKRPSERGAPMDAPLVERRRGSRQLRRYVLPAVLVLILVAIFVSQSLERRQHAEQTRLFGTMAQLNARVLQLGRDVGPAARGEAAGFAGLRLNAQKIEALLSALQGGYVIAEPEGDLPTVPEQLLPRLGALERSWNTLRADIQSIQRSETIVAEIGELGKNIGRLLENARRNANDVITRLEVIDASPREVAALGDLLVLIERMTADVVRAQTVSDAGLEAARRLQQELTQFTRITDALLSQGAKDQVVRQGVQRLALLFSNNVLVLDDFLQTASELYSTQNALRSANVNVDAMLRASEDLKNGYVNQSRAGVDYATVASVLGAVALIGLLAVLIQLVRDGRARALEAHLREEEIREANRRNQDSILQLLDEIGALADGDLTTRATVTEEVTGAISDAINYAIDALRELVEQINVTSEQVSVSAQNTRTRAIQLSAASGQQTDQIVKATSSIEDMASSIEQVSGHAAESSQVAQASVDIAAKGARAVHETIAGMDEIKGTIEETAARMMRLGESSQEIGDMVGLIDDISDQTNVLALNAAIQASMAGESGRGFAVVADEVQRLAERAGEATKRIEVLVRNIQNDTDQVLRSMEISTAGVTAGTHLAREAGGSLDEIENVSQHLAGLIRSISEASRTQAMRASAIATTMSAIRKFAAQTRGGTNASARSIGELVELAAELKRSVAGFRLPERAADGTVVDLRPGNAEREWLSLAVAKHDADRKSGTDDDSNVTVLHR